MAKEAIFLIGKNAVEVPRRLAFFGTFSHHRSSSRSTCS